MLLVGRAWWAWTWLGASRLLTRPLLRKDSFPYGDGTAGCAVGVYNWDVAMVIKRIR